MFVEVAEAEELIAPLAEIDLAQLDPESVLDLGRASVRLRRVLDALEAHTLVTLRDRNICDKRLGLKTTTWYARETGCSLGHARTRVATAQRLATLPLVDAEIADGRLSWDRARVVTDATNDRNADGMAGIQNELLDLSEGSTYRRFTTDVDELARLLDPDGPEPLTTDDSKLSIRPNAGGGIHLRGDLYGDHADIVKTAIGSVADQLFRQHQTDHDQHLDLPVPSRNTLHAHALADLCRGTATPEIRVVIPADHVTGELDCDSALRAIIIDTLGEPLDIGRRSRRFTDAIRAALALRDGGCIWPGCDQPPEHCDGHHIHHWPHGGRTSLDNAVLLCRHHHRVTHRIGWRLHWNNGHPEITGPDGTTHPTQRHHRTRAPTAA